MRGDALGVFAVGSGPDAEPSVGSPVMFRIEMLGGDGSAEKSLFPAYL